MQTLHLFLLPWRIMASVQMVLGNNVPSPLAGEGQGEGA